MKSLSQLSSWLNNKCKILSKPMSRPTDLESDHEPSHEYAHMFIDAGYTSQGKQGRVSMVNENIKIFTLV